MLTVLIFHPRKIGLMVDGQFNHIANFNIPAHRPGDGGFWIQGFIVVDHRIAIMGNDWVDMHCCVNLIVNDYGTTCIRRGVIPRPIGGGNSRSNMWIALQPLGININGVAQSAKIWQVRHCGINHMATDIQVHHIINFRVTADCTANGR